ncbi:MAG TPA: hypothetical protein PKY96_11850, partial [Flavobacteriales bacterium]|nr:hypothetical protein [Flavobacteriales bacterium]
MEAMQEWSRYGYGDLIESDAWYDLHPLLAPYQEAQMPFDAPTQASIQAAMQGSDIDPMLLSAFFTKWNTSLEAYAN